MQGIDRRRWLALALSSPVALAGCGGGTDTTKAHVRFVNASGYDGLRLLVDDDDLHGAVAPGDETRYRDVDPGDADSEIVEAVSRDTLATFTPSLSEDDHYTVLAWGALGELQQVLIREENAEPDDDEARIRVFNGAADAGALDVYVTTPTASLEAASPLVLTPAVGELPGSDGFRIRGAGVWRIRVTAAGSKSDLRLDVGGVRLEGGSVHTLVLSSAAGGVLVDGLLLRERTQQQQRLATTKARLRVAAAAADGAAVTATVGDRHLLTTVGIGATLYELVDAGTVSVATTVGGTPATRDIVLAPGSDNTLVVHGSASGPASVLLVDDNVTLAAKARVRLVNALVGAGALSLKIESTVFVPEVGAGSASDYADVADVVDATLEIVHGGAVLATLADKDLEAGKIYTVLAGGSLASPLVALLEDR